MIQLTDVWAARRAIDGYVHPTPLIGSQSISALAGAPVYFKCENQQKTGSFKVRGAFHLLLGLSAEEKKRGVVCYSSGNHAQAVCYAARQLGIEAWAFMPETATPAKVDACRGYGGQVVLTGRTGAEAMPRARDFARERGCVWVDPVEDERIMAGQGTAGLEMLTQLPQADAIFVPVGGGGLLSGVLTAVKGLSPATRVIGVEPENMNCMSASLAAGAITRVPRRPSLADGLAGDAPGPLAFEAVSRLVDTVITVSEEDIARATLLILQRTKQFIEPSAAASLAGLLSGRGGRGKANICLLTGGNANLSVLAELFA